jgi:hypothetical protein
MSQAKPLMVVVIFTPCDCIQIYSAFHLELSGICLAFVCSFFYEMCACFRQTLVKTVDIIQYPVKGGEHAVIPCRITLHEMLLHRWAVHQVIREQLEFEWQKCTL